jgi:hypothetical protein
MYHENNSTTMISLVVMNLLAQDTPLVLRINLMYHPNHLSSKKAILGIRY